MRWFLGGTRRIEPFVVMRPPAFPAISGLAGVRGFPSLRAKVSKVTSFFILGALAGIVVAGGWFAWLGQGGTGAAAGTRVLKFAHSLPTDHPVHKGLEELGRRLEERSGGKLKLALFPNGQLGSETQCLEKVQTGTLDMTKTSAAPIGNFISAYKIFSLPYLFRDGDHYWHTLDGPVGGEMLGLLAKTDDGSASGLHGLGYFDSGSRSFYTVDPVKTPADLRGKKIRVMSDEVAMDMVQALGGSPTPIAYGELYTALKQGTVDGAENNPPSFVTSRHYEICKNYVLDEHSRIPDVIVISSKVWDSLTAEERGWLHDSIADASQFQRELWKTDTEKSMKDLEAAGVKVVVPDIELFRKAVAPVVEKYSNVTTRPLIEKIRAVQ